MSKHISVGIGVLILIAALAYVRSLGVKSEFEYVILRTLMAIAGGYATAGLLGAIEVQNKLVKATGGIAVSALLFVVNPVSTVAVASAPLEQRQQIDTVDSLLKVTESPETEKHVEAAVDSISKSLGYRDYGTLRVLGSPKSVAALRDRAVLYRQTIGS